MSCLLDALNKAAATLAISSPTSRLDAELLAAHLLGIGRSELLLKLQDLPAPDGLDALISARGEGMPVAYLIGQAEFWSLPLLVSPDVLIPRPDSETLIEVAVSHYKMKPSPQRILDLGTGSGALLLAALSEFVRAAGVGIDASAKAANIAMENAAALALGGRADIRCMSWHEPNWWQQLDGPFDLILCNPPYISEDDPETQPAVRQFEPHEALFAAEGGLAEYRHLLAQLPLFMADGGIALFEIGHRQSEAVMALAVAHKFNAIQHTDLAGKPRVVSVHYA